MRNPTDFDMSNYYENRWTMNGNVINDETFDDFECIDCAVIGGICSDCIAMED